ncbi:right-handed parallel beta-helix repeat-containing protein [Saprospiraceae bacterium]|nr:right-handed parallel beta-helix repeat-containing protein [Saprospiraceae bacterium]
MSKSLKTSLGVLLFCISVMSQINAQNYYIDYELGNDDNIGTSTSSPWKHCPGDKYATGLAAQKVLEPSETVVFKGNTIYRGSIEVNANGTSLDKIRYIGNEWGAEKAILDGGSVINDWVDEGNGVYSQMIPSNVNYALPGSFNFHQTLDNETKRLNVTQFPQPDDPFFFDDISNYNVVKNQDISLQSIRDTGFFDQSDIDYWNGSSILIFVNPNLVIEREISSFDPSTSTIFFDPLPPNSIYPDGRDHFYAIYNSNHYLIQDGSYFVDFTNDKVYVNPYSEDLPTHNIAYSSETIGFNLNNKSNIEISGFEIKNYGGDIFIDAIGIGKSSFSNIPTTGIEINDNIIHDNRNGSKGNGGIYLPSCSDIQIRNNLVQNNVRSAGIFTSIGDNVLIESNTIVKCGSTNIRLYVVSNAMVIRNKIYEARGRHANGITAYLGCYDILFASNEIYDAITPITFQNSGNLYFHNNIIDSRTPAGGINEWGRTSNENCTNGTILITNNTILTNEDKIAIAVEKSLNTTQQGSNSVGPNEYFVYNNIIDAGGLIYSPDNTDYNLYTSLSWQQTPPWSPNTNEIIGDRNFNDMFTAYNSDFSLLENSDAINAGDNLISILPVEKFPNYDFTKDVYGLNRGTNTWSIGAAELANTTTSIEVESNLFTLYPNPSTGRINFEFEENRKLEFIRIFSLDGTNIYNEKTDKRFINLSLESGAYILLALFSDGTEIRKTFIHMK